ncbi:MULTISPECIES: hypothetical protein [unclassified Methanoregula]|uniref:hypothetical protein n=1 Tax=unclassified Methanoregula TaxID=2649730 RepID=UPI0009C5F80B|nr:MULTISPECIES: hypothetical protein [unclassified Methanoregula]OPX64740.1 MAG: hypothetical protein A4E33_00710 [Methanoregula sp. PtaB.Bin085]OPY35210.1 MAG: hypothetical protein A4E34_00887 [Methanoregula sp. PtaU1.Bin006]
MASFNEFFGSAFFLIINTVILIVVTFTAGTILDWLAVWVASQPKGLLSAVPVMHSFATFYGMIVLIEIGLFVQLYLTTIKRTSYSTGESDF